MRLDQWVKKASPFKNSLSIHFVKFNTKKFFEITIVVVAIKESLDSLELYLYRWLGMAMYLSIWYI